MGEFGVNFQMEHELRAVYHKIDFFSSTNDDVKK